jgi:hypothetical protein
VSGTTNYVVKFASSSTVATGSIFDNGSIGIGTSSPGGILDVQSSNTGDQLVRTWNTNTAGTGKAILRVANSGNNAQGTQLQFTDLNYFVGTIASDRTNGMAFYVGQQATALVSERIRIDINGYVGIGTSNTTPYSSLFSGQLVIDTGTSAVDGIFSSTNSANAAELILTKKNTTNGFGSLVIQHAGTSGDAIVVNYSVNTSTGAGGTNSFKVTTDGNGYFRGSVGIGTTSPTTKLAVSDGTTIAQVNPSSGVAYFGTVNNYPMALSVNSSEKVRILNDGNVGIGTSSPLTKLVISNGSNENFEFGPGESSLNGGYIEYINRNSGSTRPDFNFYLGGGGGSYKFYTNGSNERMRITSAGNIGIGTSSPGSLLHLQSSATTTLLRIDNSNINNDAAILLTDNNNPTGEGLRITYDSSAGDTYFNNIFTASTRAFNFQKGDFGSGTDLLTILNNGNVGIGTTSPSSAVSFNKVVEAYDATSLSYQVNSGGTYKAEFGISSASGWLGTSTAHDMRFASNGTERMRILSGGSIGIGTSSPLAKLQVSAGRSYFFSGDQYSVGLAQTAAQANYMYLGTATDGTFYISETGGTARVTVQQSGNVGIGTTSPTAKLHVEGLSFFNNTISSSNKLVVESTQPGIILRETDQSGTTHRWIDVESGIFRILQTNNDYSSFVTQFVINSSGNVGIGTTAPAYKLDVQGITTTARLGNAIVGALPVNTLYAFFGHNSLDHASTAANYALLQFSDGTTYLNASTTKPINFRIANADKMILDANGNLGIGTTSPVQKLHVYSSGGGFEFNPGSTCTIESIDRANTSANVNTAYYTRGTGYFAWYNGSYTERMRIISDGNVGIGTTAPAYKLEVNGSFAASTKSFKIDHPTKTGKKLVYGSLESPYHGIRLTGKDKLVNGKCKVQLPDYICKLVRSESVNVQLTGIKCGKTLYIDDINVAENYFVVAYDKSLLESNKTYEFFWDFTAIRSDVPELITEV